MRQNRTRIISCLFISLALLISACSSSSNQDSAPGEAPILVSPEDLDSLVMLAKFDLTLKTGIDLDKIETESTEEFNFSDASLGVAEPGADYAQVITPGYIIMLIADGITYEYHASGERVVQVPKE
jgi:hypothetical protein